MRRRTLDSKILLCLAMSFMVVLSLCILDVLSGQDAYAMGGGGGKNKGNLARAKTLQVPSASDTPAVSTTQPIHVPEPSTLILIGAGAIGVAVAAYRKKGTLSNKKEDLE